MIKKISYLIVIPIIVFGLSLIFAQGNPALAFGECIGKSLISPCTGSTPIQCSSSQPYTGILCCKSSTDCTNNGNGYSPSNSDTTSFGGNINGNGGVGSNTTTTTNTTNRVAFKEPKCDNGDVGIQTAIGCIHALSSPDQFFADILRWAVGIGGGIAFLLILYAGFMIMSSSGNPERLKAGQELLTSAISGLILLVFSVFILKFIGIDILELCKFGFGTPC